MKQKQLSTQKNTGRRIARCEMIRMWMIFLSAVLLIGGYVAAFRPAMLACIAPLAIAALLTYRIKHLEKSADDGGSDTDELL